MSQQFECRPFGSWLSSVSSRLVGSQSLVLMELSASRRGVFWVEARLSEAARCAVVKWNESEGATECFDAPFSAQSRVHEYGGGAITTTEDRLYFVNLEDQAIYEVALASDSLSKPRKVAASPDVRFADGDLCRGTQTLVVVAEDHSLSGQPPTNFIASIDVAARSAPRRVVQGNDFYAAPRVSKDGRLLAWVTWNHPRMPWEQAELWTGTFDASGQIGEQVRIAGAPGVSVLSPEWSADGSLLYVSDKGGWWNLWRYQDGVSTAVLRREAEFAHPPWVFGNSTYAVLLDGRIACAYVEKGEWSLAVFDPRNSALDRLDIPYSSFRCVRTDGVNIYAIAGSPEQAEAVVRIDPSTRHVTVLKETVALADTHRKTFSKPQPIAFRTSGKGEMAHGFFYRPQNPRFRGVRGTKPPLIVHCHSGPTSAANNVLNVRHQFWTSRGFALVDVNYRGSTGFGRAYRERLDGQWGVVDAEDCAAAVEFLIGTGEVDPTRIAITGSSAGGFTALVALVESKLFCAGSSHFGVCDLGHLRRGTHKFESHYLDSLVGVYETNPDLYESRSPARHIDRMSSPVYFAHGALDPVVPIQQTEAMVAALQSRGIPVLSLVFETESHGFRFADSIEKSLEAELSFYALWLSRCELRF